jgi:hypothetical protein
VILYFIRTHLFFLSYETSRGQCLLPPWDSIAGRRWWRSFHLPQSPELVHVALHKSSLDPEQRPWNAIIRSFHKNHRIFRSTTIQSVSKFRSNNSMFPCTFWVNSDLKYLLNANWFSLLVYFIASKLEYYLNNVTTADSFAHKCDHNNLFCSRMQLLKSVVCEYSCRNVCSWLQLLKFVQECGCCLKISVLWDVALCRTIALMMESVNPSETPVSTYQITRRNIPEDSQLLVSSY